MSTDPVSRRRRALVTVGVAAPWLAPSALAQTSPGARPAVEEFFKFPLISQVRLAPGGKCLCGVREFKGRRNAVVVDLATRKALIVTNYSDFDVTGLAWVNADRLIYRLFDRSRGSGDQVPSGLLVVNRDGTGAKALSGIDDPRLLPLNSSFEGRVRERGLPTDDIFVSVNSMQARGKFSSDLYRVNTTTGRKTLLTLGGPSDAVEWLPDTNNVVRAAVSSTKGVTRVHLRDNADAPWRTIFEFKAEEVVSQVIPLRFDASGVLHVAANAGADFTAIHRLDPQSARLEAEPLAAIKGFDLNGPLRFTADGSELIGIEYRADRPGVAWVHPKAQALQAQIDQALPATVNALSGAVIEDDGVILVEARSDVDPGRYFIYDKRKKELEQVAVERPWIKPEAMRPTRFYRYAARDGLSIPAQLTLPDTKAPHPLVVLHYGGPWVRAVNYGWDPIVQFLVSRGYAVFMPAPRASTGFGARLYQAGWKQWGLGMQDDVTDGVRALISGGVVDAKRVAIAGASYGGYLAMMALVKEPGLFKCGINWVGVTDPSFMFTVSWTDFNRVDSGRYSLPLLIGDPDGDAEQFKRTSPVARAAEIKQPVLMAYGGLDRRVPLINGEKMRSALKPHNPNVEWIVYPDEGHGWLKLDNNIDFWMRVEKFLAANL